MQPGYQFEKLNEYVAKKNWKGAGDIIANSALCTKVKERCMENARCQKPKN